MPPGVKQVAGPGMPPKPPSRLRLWIFTVRFWPVLVVTFSQVQLMTWKGWDSWLWAAPFLAGLYLVVASLTRGEKAVKALEEVRADLKAVRAEWHD